MSEFVNTLDIREDIDVFEEIVNGSITEYKDNTLKINIPTAFYTRSKLETVELPLAKSINPYAFHSCSALVNTDFSSVTSVGVQGLIGCSSLKKLDFPLLTSIAMNAFSNDSKLIALILRKNQVCGLGQTSALNGTPIASGTGYIYVPSSLVATYQTATNWSTFSAQFRALEDYTVDGTTTGELDESKI